MDLIKKIYTVDENGENPVYAGHEYIADENDFWGADKLPGHLSINVSDIAHANVPDGMDSKMVLPVHKLAIGKTYDDSHTFTADNPGAGADVDLVFDGVDTVGTVIGAHNTANPSDTISITTGNGADVVIAQAVNMSGGADYTHVVDQTKVDAQTIVDLGTTYYTDVYAELETRFGTNRNDSVVADYETWKMMSSTPADWSGLGLLAMRATASFAVDDALDTDQKVQDYANECMADIVAYGIWRAQRKKQYKDDVAAV